MGLKSLTAIRKEAIRKWDKTYNHGDKHDQAARENYIHGQLEVYYRVAYYNLPKSVKENPKLPPDLFPK